MTQLLSDELVAAADNAVLTPDAVVYHRCGSTLGPAGHDQVTKKAVARALAELLDVPFAGELDLLNPVAGALVVPSDTIEGLAEARRLGIERPEQMFGGVVPHPFVATKLITHPLVRPDAVAPEGWSAAFGAAVESVVLPGYSVFDPLDALEAGRRLLAGGGLRIKEPGGVGGSGQYVVADLEALNVRIGALDPALLRDQGLVLERNLSEVTTHSVGQVRVGPWCITYVGTQQLTRNHHGAEVYGGSMLTVVRGGEEALLALPLTEAQRTAARQALAYHRAALASFPGLMASRCNYDVVEGDDAGGRRCFGVLEQSWRIGGASGAEAAALLAFRADPALQVVRASTHEVYGDDVTVPPGARIFYDGIDEHVGRLTKYTLVETDGYP